MTFIEGNMNAWDYVDILRSNLLTSATKLGIQDFFHFQQDNDPKHSSNITRLWLLYNMKNQLIINQQFQGDTRNRNDPKQPNFP